MIPFAYQLPHLAPLNMLGPLLWTNMWFSAFLGIWALPVLSRSTGVSKLTENLGNSIKFGLPLLISRGGARSSIKFIQLNYCCQEHVPELPIYGSNFYKCEREGTGGEKHYEKKGPRQSQKIGSKQTGCTCQVMVKAYPGTDTLLGKYTDDHDHPIGVLNLIYTRVFKNAKGKIREMLQQRIQLRKVVCNHCFTQGIG